jgi:hypothetical protein
MNKDVLFYLTGFENFKFSYSAAKKCPTIVGEIGMMKPKTSTVELKIANTLDLSIRKLVAGILVLIDKFPEKTENEILESVAAQSIGISEIELYSLFLYAGDFLSFESFIDYGAKGIAKIWSTAPSSDFFRDNYEMKEEFFTKEEVARIQELSNKHILGVSQRS